MRHIVPARFYSAVVGSIMWRTCEILLHGKPPLIYEDGLQKRDFVSVYDVASACRLALTTKEADGEAINISSGQAMTVSEVAKRAIRSQFILERSR